MAIVGNISGSSSQSYQIGLTGSVIIGRPAQNETHLPEIGTDVVLFVSGSPGGRGVSTDSAAKRKSTAVIGGDLLTSGNVYFVSKETWAHVTNPSLVFSNVGSDVVFFVSGNQGGIEEERGVSLIGGDLVVSGGAIFESGRTGDGDFIVNSKNYLHRFKVDSEVGAVIIGEYGDGGALADGPHSDTLFFVSGSRGAKDGDNSRIATFGGDLVVSGNTYIIPRGRHEKDSAVMSKIGSDVIFFVSGAGAAAAGGSGKDYDGTSVFGGDLVVSGVIYGGVDVATSTTLLELNAGLNIISSHAGSDNVDPGNDVILFVSGSPDTRASSTRGVSVIGGDLFVSGNSYFVPGGDHEEDTGAFASVGTNVHFFVSGVNGVGLQDEDTGLGDSGAILLGGDTIISGALVVSPADGNLVRDWQVDFGSPEFSGSGIKFVVSGAVGLQGTGTSNGLGEATVMFIGDTVISGSLIVGEGRGVDGANDWYGGTISGSIHHTEDGLSYIRGDGDNITVTSASNGQIMISLDADGDTAAVDGIPATNQIAIWTDANTLKGESTLTYDGTTISLNDAVTINEGGADNDFRVEGGSGKQGMILVDAGTGQVGILTDGTAAANAYGTNASTTAIPGDVGLFISGTQGGHEEDIDNSVACFGGDIVLSGTLHVEQGEYGAVFAKTQHTAHDLASGATDTIEGRAGTITITVNGTISNGSPIGMITFTNSDIKATDVIVPVTSVGGILVFASGVTAGEFTLHLSNSTGGNVNNDSTFIINWVAL